MGRLQDLLEQLDADPGVRGRQFERICQWYLTHDPGYRRVLERVWLWDEWPGNDGRDIGIDLVAEDRSGHLWAAQAKAYDPSYAITKHDIDTFLSASGTAESSFRLLIATTDRIGGNAKRTIDSQEKPVHLHMRSDLAASAVEWPSDPVDLRAVRPARKAPRPHQREAIEAVVAGFDGHDRGQLLMACGTGKTLTTLWLAERLGSKRTLVLVPSLSLLSQTLTEWTAQATEDFDFLPVCSDPTVRSPDEWVSSTSELGFPVTTDPEQIASFLRRRRRSVVFATYQSSPRIAEAYAIGRVPAFDVVVADEAHRTAGPDASDFATVLDADRIRARKRLFTTATPRYFTGRIKKVATEADYEVASMDDESRYGPVFHRLTFGEAIQRDLLSDYRVVIVGVDDPTYREYVERGRLVTIDGGKVTDARTLAAHIALAKAMRRFDLHRTISFHSRIKRARDFAKEFARVTDWMPPDTTPAGPLWTKHVSGEMPTGKRRVLLNGLRAVTGDQRGLLTNARCLAEGVDVPTLDGVAFVDPRQSQVDIIQAVGRAIRKAEDKSVGTVVLPVFIEGHEDPDAAIEASAFRRIGNILRALRNQDDQLADSLDTLRRQVGRTGLQGRLPDKLVIDLPDHIGREFVRALEMRLVETASSTWEYWLGLLLSFVDRMGHARVLASHTESGRALGNWVNFQRAQYRRGALSAERKALLESVPGWIWEAADERWELHLLGLVRFIEEHGHSRVPVSVDDGDLRLGYWVRNQRSFFRSGRLSRTRADRLAALASWEWDPKESDWLAALTILDRYTQREGHANVPLDHIEDDFRLGNWVNRQRYSYRTGRLSPKRAALLERVSTWQWNPQVDAWEEGLDRIRRYAAERGTSQVVKSLVLEDGYALGNWVAKQRRDFKSGRLRAERIERLEALPKWAWDTREASWYLRLRSLQSFVQREGHASVPSTYRDENGFLLGQWADNQRGRYRAGKLSAEQVRRLEETAGWKWRVADPDR